MSRITRITGPDGRVTTIKQTSGCGCLTVLAFLVVIFGPAAWFGTTGAVLAYSGLGVAIVAFIAIAAWRSGRHTKGVPVDGPEKDAAYWARYVARVSGNPEPPPVQPPPPPLQGG